MTDLRAWLAAEPFTLVLSGGFFGFFAHTGLLAALEEAGLRPRRVVGCSAGALAGGLWAAGLPAAALEAELRGLRKEHFWDPGLPLGGLLKGRKFVALLEQVLERADAPARIEETTLPFAPVVHDVLRRRPWALETGPLPLAIRASCTVPLLFRPVRWERTLLVDGGVSDRAGFSALRPGERALYHHLLPGAIDVAFARAVPSPGATCRTIAVPGLPRVGPDRLDAGLEAYAQVRAHAATLLGAPARTGR